MSETTEVKIEETGTEKPEKTSKVKPWMVILLVLLGLALILVALYFSWFKPMILKPLGATLSVPQISVATNTVAPIQDTATNVPTVTNTPEHTPTPTKPPVCGEEAVWHVLMVGTDTSGYHFSAGLADVIRIARVDFTEMKVDMLALPRDLLVNAPEDYSKKKTP